MGKVFYEGQRKRIVWAEDRSGAKLAERYFESLPASDKAKVDRLLRKMADQGRIYNEEQFRYEGVGIYCFKRNQHRLPCFFHGGDVIVTHGFRKQRRTFPERERERALRIRDWYLSKWG